MSRPYLIADGGDIDFIKYEDGLVYVKLLGACLGCSSSGDTITNSVEALLLEEVPGVIAVRLASDKERFKEELKKNLEKTPQIQ